MFVSYIHSVNGFSSLIPLKNLNADVLKDIEKFAKEELSDLLTDEYILLDAVREDVDNVHFFGLFAAKPEKFRLLPGERIAILELANYAKSLAVTDDAAFAEFHTEKTSRSNTVQLPIGTFFGTKVARKATTASTPLSNDQLRDKLIPKLKSLISMVNPKLDFQKQAVQMDLKVINRNDKITATINCLFCLNKGEKEPKKYIQFDVPPNCTNGYWNPANFKKHLQMKHMGKKVQLLMATESKEQTENVKARILTQSVGKPKASKVKSSPDASIDEANAAKNNTPTSSKAIATNAEKRATCARTSIIPSRTSDTKTVAAKQNANNTSAKSKSKVPKVHAATRSKASSDNASLPTIYTPVSSKVIDATDGTTPTAPTITSANTSIASINSSVITSPDSSLTIIATSSAKVKRVNSIRSVEDLIYNQISEQNLRLLQATITHKIKKYTMKYSLMDEMRKLKVMRIDKDGSCLFSSIS